MKEESLDIYDIFDNWQKSLKETFSLSVHLFIENAEEKSRVEITIYKIEEIITEKSILHTIQIENTKQASDIFSTSEMFFYNIMNEVENWVLENINTVLKDEDK